MTRIPYTYLYMSDSVEPQHKVRLYARRVRVHARKPIRINAYAQLGAHKNACIILNHDCGSDQHGTNPTTSVMTFAPTRVNAIATCYIQIRATDETKRL